MSLKTDFPFYDGRPVEIRPLGWLAVIASVIAAFALLITLPFYTFPLNLLPAIVYAGLPLLTLALVSGGHQMALFGRFGFRELFLSLGFGFLTIIVSGIVGLALLQVVQMAANPVTEVLASAGPADYAVFLLRTAVQLVGEELMTILPLLAVLWFCVRKLGMSRRVGLIAAVAVSTIWFAAVHLPTYRWNFIQCFAGIGSARLVLTAAYLVTRNLWVSAGAHVANDWTEFLLPEFLGAMHHGPIDPVG